MEWIYDLAPGTFALCVLALMFVASELGYRFGRRADRAEPEQSRMVSSAIKGTIFGLVALLLGFSYSMTSNRHNQRLQLVLDEANAIGTCYLRAGLLSEPPRGEIRAALRRYTDLRIEHFERALDETAFQRTSSGMDSALVALWSGVTDATSQDQSQILPSQIVPAANAVIDLSATWAWSTRVHLPPSVLVLLAASMLVSAFLIGHSSGQVRRRHLGLWVALNVLIMLVLFVVMDFDRARHGLIQVDHTALIEVQRSMRAGS